jgi:spheroidene monooxygenase
VPGLRFAKVLGSGHEGGFGLRPSGSRLGLFLLFDGEAPARAFVDRSPQLQAWRAHAAECCVALLRPTAARGRWAGHALAVAAGAAGASGSEAAPGPVAALTRASIRPSRALAFWRHAPSSEAALARAPGCRLAVGLGEAPLLRQATFSVWDSVEAMEAYAHGAAHGEAIRAAYGRGCFSESLFARFVPLALQGRWKGRAYG